MAPKGVTLATRRFIAFRQQIVARAKAQKRAKMAKSRSLLLGQYLKGNLFTAIRTLRSSWSPILSTLVLDNSGYQSTQAYGFDASNLTNVTEYTTLFDQFKIKYVDVKIVPRFISNDNTTQNNYTLQYFRDYDDADLTTLQYNDREKPWLENTLVKTVSFNKPITIRVYPKVLGQVFQSTVSTAYTPKKAWLDCNDISAPHYGLKIRIYDPYATEAATDPIATVYETYHMLFKGQR